MANILYGQNKADGKLDGATSNYLDFCSGYVGNLLLGGITIDETASAAVVSSASTATIAATTLRAGAYNNHTGTTGGAGGIYLPPAIKDAHLAMEISGDWDSAVAITIFTRGSVGAGTDVVFAKQVAGIPNGATLTSVETLGTATVPTSIKLIWTPAAGDTNQWGPGSVLHFYAPADDIWLFGCFLIADTTGATGVLTTSAS